VIPWLVGLATTVGFHKPRATNLEHETRSSRLRASSPRHEQGGSLLSSWRESAGASRHSPPNRQPAVVGLAAPPYGLPSTDPTTPAPTARLRRTVGPSSRCSSGSRGWSAHADNRPRSAFPLDLLPSRGDRPPERPQRRPSDQVLVPTIVHAPPALSRPWEYQ
jgi:hypothetical protein